MEILAALLAATGSAIFGYWLGNLMIERAELRVENEQLRARIRQLEAQPDYLKGESE